ncbi:hypothetical protein [Ornithinimicrobium pekingense]|uniref:Uncharacterized protein n=1 Tax=Ornithinimicrobium pekingense TaxID=384677 RepID=A0ABQ2F4L2_9MICO|nr:hypothetical protein [Ornithinimicrobium pekingense]GGK61392.1 hypothetical protein GCM10011509_07260 [Ornithinimicrobium pekingense]
MPWWRRPTRIIGPEVPPAEGRPDDLPGSARPELGRGEQVLATAREDATGHWLVLTTWRLLERTEDGTTVLDRPWHEVDTGSWDPDTWVLSVLFVDGLHGRQWRLQRLTGPGRVPEVFRDRTTASVVLTRPVELGARRTARVTVRTDLQSRELREQVLLGRGARDDDRELAAAVLLARQELREQTGMEPLPPPA